MHGQKRNLVIADDHPVVLLGIQSILQDHPKVNLIGTALNSTELFALLNSARVDMVLTDYAMPGGAYGDGLEMLDRLKSRFPDVALIVLTVLTNPALLSKIVQLGVHGLLNKGSDLNEIPLAISRVADGYKYLSNSLTAMLAIQSTRPDVDKIALLSKKELEVLRLYLGGMSVQAIADHFRRSGKTISNQKRMGMQKLACANDAELFLLNSQVGLTNIAPPEQEHKTPLLPLIAD
ncbi:response regulator transcription factor [Glaciimonas immobilis]|uniref:Two-component system capsular synthesis response regulator RcsB n=1 Tax=Glaciimonas immobilis TaxID=728004 RepID=A0A840RXT9_9BURK|nr:response regulator transcription factor [Glaciimonas immobilis]KAF3998293.1 response regulator transcription factor [Glaciimonas immobilis]MBB5201908.1 two-component system capsular synthesis response regulator RcsB [Glaciimonas immobilis]